MTMKGHCDLQDGLFGQGPVRSRRNASLVELWSKEFISMLQGEVCLGQREIVAGSLVVGGLRA